VPTPRWHTLWTVDGTPTPHLLVLYQGGGIPQLPFKVCTLIWIPLVLKARFDELCAIMKEIYCILILLFCIAIRDPSLPTPQVPRYPVGHSTEHLNLTSCNVVWTIHKLPCSKLLMRPSRRSDQSCASRTNKGRQLTSIRHAVKESRRGCWSKVAGLDAHHARLGGTSGRLHVART